MRHWSQLATKNWRARKATTCGAVFAVTLGVAAVVWVMCCHESVRQSAISWSSNYVGSAHITVSSRFGKLDQIPERLVRQLETVENVAVVNPRLTIRRTCLPVARRAWDAGAERIHWSRDLPDVDLRGVQLETDLRLRSYSRVAGRMLTADDEFACMLENRLAREHGVGPGDYLLAWDESRDRPYVLEIVGLLDMPRVGKIQKPLALLRLDVLQKITLKYALVSAIDVTLAQTDPASIGAAESVIRVKARHTAPSARISSAEARLRQVQIAQDNQRLVLVMLASVAVLTALFIILSTLSMGMVERVRQLGLLRCVGMTRLQLAWLVLYEVLPLGVVGVVLGVVVGLGLTRLSVWLTPDYVGSYVVSWYGLLLAAGAGLATALLAALLPAAAVLRVSPMEAARPRAKRPRHLNLFIVGGMGVVLLAIQYKWVLERAVRDVNFMTIASVAVIMLYFGYALLAPPIVRLAGNWAVVIAARLLHIRTRLLQDQVGHAAWRSAGICCGLMVGLSMVVGILVVNESVTRGWQFPTQFPAAFGWSYAQLSPETRERVGSVPGVGTYTVANSINVYVEERNPVLEKMLLSVTWFMGVDPDTFIDLIRMEFIEGDAESARALLKQGGHIMVADDFSRSRNKHLGDDVKIYDERARRWRHFTVAGVARSPALDIAAAYFQLSSDYSVAASGSVMGTNDDLKRRFGVDGANLVLLNFDLPDEPPPPGWPPPPESREALGMSTRCYDESIPLERRWRRWRELQVLSEVRRAARDPAMRIGAVADLKDEIDDQLTGVTGLLTAIPGVALLVAAIGVANLMNANIIARAKQIAVSRAVGATRGLILRIVIGEAMVLGLLGSALGLGLGVHLASNITRMADRMWGFQVALELPWNYVFSSIGLTIGLCLIAGLIPARHAARTNIVDALHVP